VRDRWYYVTREPIIVPTLFSAHDHGRLNAARKIEVLPIKGAFGSSTAEVRSFARRTCRMRCNRPPRDLCVPPSVVSSPHSPTFPRLRRSYSQLLSWGSTHPFLGRPGPGIRGTLHPDPDLGRPWKRNPNSSCSVSARLRLSSAVFYSHT